MSAAEGRRPDDPRLMGENVQVIHRLGGRVIIDEECRTATIVVLPTKARDFTDAEWLIMLTAATIVRAGFEYRGWDVKG